MSLTPQLIKSLMFEHFRTGRSQQVMDVAGEVAKLAFAKGLLASRAGQVAHYQGLDPMTRDHLADHVQQVMWQLLAQGALVWGLGATSNNTYPFYRLTEYGRTVVKEQAPQPYDPDGFIREFDRLVPGADPILKDYLVEAVRAFNSNCFKSAAVMLGAASEQAVLLLHTGRDPALASIDHVTGIQLYGELIVWTVFLASDVPLAQGDAMSDTTTGATLLRKTRHAVEGFLIELQEMTPDKLDCLALERSAMKVVLELGLGMMKEVFRRADEDAPEVVVNGSRWGNRVVSNGTYVTKFGSFTQDRSGYQQSGRGRALFPVDLRLGVVEGRYTPGMARVMAHTIAQMPPEDGEEYLKELGLAQVSKSTLHRIPQDMAALYELNRAAIEAVVRGESRVPEGTRTVQVGLDGVMVPMDGEDTKPRGRKTSEPEVARHERHYGPTAPSPADHDGKKGVAYHEASVGTLSYYDAQGERLSTVYLARMPEYRKEALAATLEAELKTVVEGCPTVEVALASDGAVTHWEHLSAMQERLPEGIRSRQLLDFCHAAKYLFDAAKLVEPDEGKSTVLAEGWRSNLRHRLDGPDIVIRALRYQRDACESDDTRDELDTIIEFFTSHHRQGRLAYKQAENDKCPLGTGTTEAAAKSVVNIRVKRAGARYTPHGGQTILTFRAALLSGRFDLTMREIGKRYSAEVRAA